jgi:hypothetical protein
VTELQVVNANEINDGRQLPLGRAIEEALATLAGHLARPPRAGRLRSRCTPTRVVSGSQTRVVAFWRKGDKELLVPCGPCRTRFQGFAGGRAATSLLPVRASRLFQTRNGSINVPSGVNAVPALSSAASSATASGRVLPSGSI